MPKFYHVIQLPLFVISQVCTKCHIEKPVEQFSSDPRYTSGYRSVCKNCRNAQRNERHKEYVSLPRPETLICTKCKIEKPVSEFYRNRGQKTGYHSRCKVCLDEQAGVQQKFVRGNNLGLSTTKWCYGCQQEKPLEVFRNDSTKKDGKTTRCRECSSLQQKDYHARNRTHRNRRSNIYWHSHYQRKGRYKSPYFAVVANSGLHGRRAYNAAYNIVHRDAILAQKKEYFVTHRLQVKQNGHKHRARKRGARIGKVDFQRILERDGYVCHICERPIVFGATGPGMLHFDHVIPLARGGAHSEENIKPAHGRCNIRKNDKLMEELTPFDRRGIL